MHFFFYLYYLNREDRQPEYSVFLGDLSSDCSEQILLVNVDYNYIILV